ncbi:Crp/Fnr family transcriptional regulator [Amycolatopsis sp. NPDC051061]|uniref:Crp/Fnr family transcriptional regulator n=1 Tax=Amycolatopsis sp. NPDC051061 TaxID=3155042 RepID=UPI00342A0AF3
MGTTPGGPGLFAVLPAATVQALLGVGVERRFQPGEVLVLEGDLTTHVMVLLSGCVKVTATTADGGRALLAVRLPGELIGELAGLDGGPRSATVTAVGLVNTRVMTQAVFQTFLKEHPDAGVALSRSVAAKLRWATDRRIDFSGYDVPIRVARVLATLVLSHGTRTARGWEIGFPMSQPELAALIGAAEPTVHKSLTELRRKSVLETGYRKMTILDLPRLRRLAALPD